MKYIKETASTVLKETLVETKKEKAVIKKEINKEKKIIKENEEVLDEALFGLSQKEVTSLTALARGADKIIKTRPVLEGMIYGFFQANSMPYMINTLEKNKDAKQKEMGAYALTVAMGRLALKGKKGWLFTPLFRQKGMAYMVKHKDANIKNGAERAMEDMQANSELKDFDFNALFDKMFAKKGEKSAIKTGGTTRRA